MTRLTTSDAPLGADTEASIITSINNIIQAYDRVVERTAAITERLNRMRYRLRGDEPEVPRTDSVNESAPDGAILRLRRLNDIQLSQLDLMESVVTTMEEDV